MKFDYIIGNPPYQEESNGDKPADESVFGTFMDATYKLSDKVELITPARFLFGAGDNKTWIKNILSDEHLKVLYYEPDVKKVFPTAGFTGGVAIHYRDDKTVYGAIQMYTPNDKLNSIHKKVDSKNESSLMNIIYNQNKYNLDNLYEDYIELKSTRGTENRITSNSLSYPCFHLNKESDDDLLIRGIVKGKEKQTWERVIRYINKKYVDNEHDNLFKYKVIIPANNGSGAIGEKKDTSVIGQPLLEKPGEGYSQSFLGVGAFNTEQEAEACLKYIKTKFARLMIGILKVTQNGKKKVYEHVPIQDFTSNSDINWTKSIEEIDAQLFDKYGLDKDEINFIRANIKEMN